MHYVVCADIQKTLILIIRNGHTPSTYFIEVTLEQGGVKGDVFTLWVVKKCPHGQKQSAWCTSPWVHSSLDSGVGTVPYQCSFACGAICMIVD